MTNSKIRIAIAVFSIAVFPLYAHAVELNTSVDARIQAGTKQDDGARAELRTSIKAGGEDHAKERAQAEIDRRITAMNKRITELGTHKHVSADTKTDITSDLQGEITSLTTLKAKIVADTDQTALKEDVMSITRSYRIFALVMPQSAVVAASDRILTTADLMSAFGAKLDTRITEAKTAGKEVSALVTLQAQAAAKIADAQVQAKAAAALVVDLTPDTGDKTKADANKKALTDARAKLKVGIDDLKAARADSEKIVVALKAMNITVKAQNTTTAQ